MSIDLPPEPPAIVINHQNERNKIMSIDVTPPPAVVEFAEKSGYKWGVEFVREWNGYQVFFPNLKPSIDVQDVGLPQYILLKNNNVRWNNDEEQKNLMYLDNQE